MHITQQNEKETSKLWACFSVCAMQILIQLYLSHFCCVKINMRKPGEFQSACNQNSKHSSIAFQFRCLLYLMVCFSGCCCCCCWRVVRCELAITVCVAVAPVAVLQPIRLVQVMQIQHNPAIDHTMNITHHSSHSGRSIADPRNWSRITQCNWLHAFVTFLDFNNNWFVLNRCASHLLPSSPIRFIFPSGFLCILQFCIGPSALRAVFWFLCHFN